ncbi:MAG: hypothetical protein AAF916_08430 [Planctomycetota bacterium]
MRWFRGLEMSLLFLAVALCWPVLGFAEPIAESILPVAQGVEVVLDTDPGHVLFVPNGLTPQRDKIDLLVHFHGGPTTVRNNAAYGGLNAAILTVNYSGRSSAYSRPFQDTKRFENLLRETRAALRKQKDLPADSDIGRLSLSSFSAGYGAIREILKQPEFFDRVDGILLADSLYASFASEEDKTPNDGQMRDFRAYAEQAARGGKVMIVTHSQVSTSTYANTQQTADDLLRHLEVRAGNINKAGLGGLRFHRTARVGNFTVWGASGDDGEAHMQHLRFIGTWLADLPISIKQRSSEDDAQP